MSRTLTITSADGQTLTLEDVEWTGFDPAAGPDHAVTMTGRFKGWEVRVPNMPADLVALYEARVRHAMMGYTDRLMAAHGVWIPPVHRGSPDDMTRLHWTWRDSQRRFRNREDMP